MLRKMKEIMKPIASEESMVNNYLKFGGKI